MKFIITLILTSTYLFATAQTYTWQRMYGDANRESAEAVVQLPDGDYVFVGATQSLTSDTSRLLLCKTDRVGNEKWQHLLATAGNSIGYDLQVIPNEGLIIAGMIADTSGQSDMYVAKVDFAGNAIWERTYGGDLNDAVTSIKYTADGGFILTGYIGTEEEGEELALIKIDQSGNIQWQTQYGGAMNERGEEVIITNDGGYAVTGFTESFGAGKSDLFLIKTDFVGNEMWLNTYGNPNNQVGYSLRQNATGGFVIAGTSEFSSYYPHDLYLLGTDADGTELWSNSYGGDARISGFSLDAVGDEGYIVAGSRATYFGFYPSDFYLFRIDNQGIKLWDRAFPNEFPATARSIVATQDGGYIVAGYAQPKDDEMTQDAQLIKTDALGNIDTTFQATLENNSPLACFGDTDGQADVWVTGGQHPYTYDWAQLSIDTFNIDNLAAATYEVTVTDANGQQMVKQTTIATPNELTLTADMMENTSCPESLDGIAQINTVGGTAPYGYLWSNGTTTESDSNLVAGTYQITVIDANACQATAELTVSSASSMAVEITEQINASCSDVNDGQLRVNVTGGNTPFTYQLGEELSNEPVFIDLAVGDYSLIIRDANGCRLTQVFSITAVAESTPTASFNQQITDLSVAFSATFSDADSVRWDFGNGTFSNELSPIYAYSQGGKYIVCVTAMNACGSTTVCNELELLDCTNATIDTDFTATNSDTIVQFTNMSVGNAESYRWRFGDGGSSREENPNYTYATMGSYEVCLTAQNACGSYTFCDSVEIALNSGILIDVAGEIQMIDG
ncbi:MAG: PKD domain-containing protein, partial [Saprospiraceae bacterium]